MREKFKLLIMCTALMMLGTGVASGQLRSGWAWGSGNCNSNGTIIGTGTYIAPSNSSDELGLKIGGQRSTYWDSWTNPTGTAPSSSATTTNSGWFTVSTQSCDCSGGVNPPTTGHVAKEGLYIRTLEWFEDYGWMWKDDYYVRDVPCCSSGSGSGTLITSGIFDAIEGTANAGMTTSNSVFYGHRVDHGHTNHMNHVRIEVSGGTPCSPNHYDNLQWSNATWYHHRNNYTFNWNTPGGAAPTITGPETSTTTNYTTTGLYNPGFGFSLGSTTKGYAETGTIKIVVDGTDIRLHNPMVANWDTTKGYFDFDGHIGNSFRFDAAFAGTPNSVTHQGASDNTLTTGPWKSIGAGNSLSGIGFWTGTSLSHFVHGGGYLWLGPSTAGQNNITISTGTASLDSILTVANYLCCDDDDDKGVNRGHGVRFNVGTIVNDTKISGTDTAKIIVKNDQLCFLDDCGTTHGDSTANAVWLKMDAIGSLPDLYKGNTDIWAQGNVYFLNNLIVPSAFGVHKIYSPFSSLVWNDDYIINNTDGINGWEHYYVKGGCCESEIIAHGLQSYTFTGEGKFNMKTDAGKITFDKNFLYSGVDGDMNMEGEGGIIVGNNQLGGDQGTYVTMSGI